MPQKQKQSKIEWVRCQICRHFLLSKHVHDHSKSCNSSQKPSLRGQQGCIIRDILVGFCKDIAKDKLAGLPRKYGKMIVFLHPVTLKQLHLALGDWAVVGNQYCILVWPDCSVALDNIGVCLSNMKHLMFPPGEPVTLYKCRSPDLAASTLTLETESKEQFLRSRQFSNFVLQHIGGGRLTTGNSICVSYFGKEIELVVSHIDPVMCNTSDSVGNDTSLQDCSLSSEESLCLEEDSESFQDLSSCMDNLNLSAQSEPSSSTPLSKFNMSQTCYTRKHTTFYTVTSQTSIKIVSPEAGITDAQRMVNRKIGVSSVGGYKSQIQCIQEMLDRTFNTLKHEHGVSSLFSPPKGVLLFGPSGCGKTLIAQALLNDYEVKKIVISGPEIWSKYFGESESRIKALFEEAKDEAPSIVFIDEVDSLCPRRETSQNDVEKRVLASLISQIDDVLSGEQPVFLLAVTSKREQIDSALRRPGRLDRELEIGVPSAAERKEILSVHLKDIKHNLTADQVTDLASSAHGYVGADLAILCKEAGLQAGRRLKSGASAFVSYEDMLHALQTVQPSAMREVAIEVPNVLWSDIGGQHELKHKLKQAVEWPLRHPEAFVRLGIRPPKGLLMYGPPGCSKTMIAKALARESGLNFIAIKGPELYSKWVGESERAVRELFRKARAAAPAIIFFDEIDALAGERGSGGGEVSDRVLAQLLTEMDGVEVLKDVTIVAATNRPDRIDKALLRPGRLDRIVYVPLLDEDTRRDIFHILFKKMPVAGEVDVQQLVTRTDKYSGAEVSAVCHEAALHAMQEDINTAQICSRHFHSALNIVTPRITPELIQFYNDYAQKSGLHSI